MDLEFPKLRALTEITKVKGRFLIEEKLDGESMIIWAGYAYGRRVSSVTGIRENKWDQLPPWIQQLAGKARHAVTGAPIHAHGELHVLGGTSSDVKSALKEGRETNWESSFSQKLRFTAYRVDGVSCDSHSHRAFLYTHGFQIPRTLELDECAAGGFVFNSHWEAKELTSDYVTIEKLISLARKLKMEGWVLKELDGERRWWKLKVSSTYDVIVTGTKDGTGMYYGDVGALYCSVYDFDANGRGFLVEVASVSGMTEAERKWMTEHRAELYGKICEVEANGVASQGRLHHPRFVRWREDKNPYECVISQLRA